MKTNNALKILSKKFPQIVIKLKIQQQFLKEKHHNSRKIMVRRIILK